MMTAAMMNSKVKNSDGVGLEFMVDKQFFDGDRNISGTRSLDIVYSRFIRLGVKIGAELEA
jgi:hypothetical protein